MIHLPKILGINNIYKICSNKIFTVKKGSVDNIVWDFQWHMFQLVFVLNELGISPFHPITKNLLTREEIYQILLKDKPTNNIDVDFRNYSKAKKLGLVAKKIKDTFTYENIGGLPKNAIRLDKNGHDAKWYESNFYLFDESKSAEIESRKRTETGQINWIIQKTPRISSASNNLIQNVPSGRIDWFENSSYSDTVLMMLFLLKLFKPKTEWQEREWKKNKDLCASLETINKLTKTYNELIGNLQANKIIQSYRFRKEIRACPDIFSMAMNDQFPYEAGDFLSSVLFLNGLFPSNYNVKKSYFFRTNQDYDIYDNLDTLTRDEIPETKPDGSPNYEDIEIENQNNDFIVFKIKVDIFKCLVEGFKTDESKTTFFDEECGRIVDEKDKLSYQLKKNVLLNRLTLKISDLTAIKSFDYVSNYYKLQEGWEMLPSKIPRFQGPDGKIIGENALTEDIGYKVNKIITSEQLDGSSKVIFFNIDRSIIESSNIIRLKIMPEEQLRINKTNYELLAIIIYQVGKNMLFFKNDGKWFIYNSNFNPDNQKEYIEEVGGYKEMLEWGDNLAIKNSVVLCYSK